jgi:cell division protein FtsL
MARTSNSVRRSQSAAYKRTPYQKTAYVNGTAVRHAEVGEGLERHLDQVSGRVPRRELEKQKQEMKRLRYRNAAYVLFLTVAFAVTGVMLISYIRMESSITQSVKQVAALQSQLNNLKTENDEMKNRIDSSINLEEIRRIAITELGMTYAGQGQIVEIPDDGSDYVRQYADIKK